jgi:photosystem II protein
MALSVKMDTYIRKSEQDFERFMRFAQRYADSSGLGYSQDSGEAVESDIAKG